MGYSGRAVVESDGLQSGAVVESDGLQRSRAVVDSDGLQSRVVVESDVLQWQGSSRVRWVAAASSERKKRSRVRPGHVSLQAIRSETLDEEAKCETCSC